MNRNHSFPKIQKSCLANNLRKFSDSVVPKGWHTCVMALCLSIIVTVCLYDVYWSFKVQSVLLQFEENPIGRWLIQIDNGDIALFMTVKMIGNLIVICAISMLHHFRRNTGIICAIAVAAFQVYVVLHLSFSHLFWG